MKLRYSRMLDILKEELALHEALNVKKDNDEKRSRKKSKELRKVDLDAATYKCPRHNEPLQPREATIYSEFDKPENVKKFIRDDIARANEYLWKKLHPKSQTEMPAHVRYITPPADAFTDKERKKFKYLFGDEAQGKQGRSRVVVAYVCPYMYKNADSSAEARKQWEQQRADALAKKGLDASKLSREEIDELVPHELRYFPEYTVVLRKKRRDENDKIVYKRKRAQLGSAMEFETDKQGNPVYTDEPEWDSYVTTKQCDYEVTTKNMHSKTWIEDTKDSPQKQVSYIWARGTVAEEEEAAGRLTRSRPPRSKEYFENKNKLATVQGAPEALKKWISDMYENDIAYRYMEIDDAAEEVTKALLANDDNFYSNNDLKKIENKLESAIKSNADYDVIKRLKSDMIKMRSLIGTAKIRVAIAEDLAPGQTRKEYAKTFGSAPPEPPPQRIELVTDLSKEEVLKLLPEEFHDAIFDFKYIITKKPTEHAFNIEFRGDKPRTKEEMLKTDREAMERYLGRRGKHRQLARVKAERDENGNRIFTYDDVRALRELPNKEIFKAKAKADREGIPYKGYEPYSGVTDKVIIDLLKNPTTEKKDDSGKTIRGGGYGWKLREISPTAKARKIKPPMLHPDIRLRRYDIKAYDWRKFLKRARVIDRRGRVLKYTPESNPLRDIKTQTLITNLSYKDACAYFHWAKKLIPTEDEWNEKQRIIADEYDEYRSEKFNDTSTRVQKPAKGLWGMYPGDPSTSPVLAAYTGVDDFKNIELEEKINAMSPSMLEKYQELVASGLSIDDAYESAYVEDMVSRMTHEVAEEYERHILDGMSPFAALDAVMKSPSRSKPDARLLKSPYAGIKLDDEDESPSPHIDSDIEELGLELPDADIEGGEEVEQDEEEYSDYFDELSGEKKSKAQLDKEESERDKEYALQKNKNAFDRWAERFGAQQNIQHTYEKRKEQSGLDKLLDDMSSDIDEPISTSLKDIGSKRLRSGALKRNK